MNSIMAKTPHDSSFSFSSRHFCWVVKTEEDENNDEEILSSFPSSRIQYMDKETEVGNDKSLVVLPKTKKKKLHFISVPKLRSFFTLFGRQNSYSHVGNKLIGTLFGYRRGNVNLAFQQDPKSYPVFLIELAMPTSELIQEMASGLVRIALECDKKVNQKSPRLLEEPLWRSYCNGRKCGLAMMFDCGPDELKVLKAVEPISVGAGVLPGSGDGSEGELMYMRARFERVVGSKDSEAFDMMNPNGNGGPQLSIYMIRV